VAQRRVPQHAGFGVMEWSGSRWAAE